MTATAGGAQGPVEAGRWPSRGPRLWEHPDVRLFAGRHRLPRSVVERIQRDRLIDAMIAVAARLGYQDASVEKVITEAGVSRRTFYDLYSDREECFLAAYGDVASSLLVLTYDAHRQGSSPRERIERTLAAFFGFWADEPDAARACMVEVLAAGPAARAKRARALEALATLIEADLGRLRGSDSPAPLAALAFVGAVHELTYMRIDRGETADLPALAQQIVACELTPLSAGVSE